jgi:hypothetical protein
VDDEYEVGCVDRLARDFLNTFSHEVLLYTLQKLLLWHLDGDNIERQGLEQGFVVPRATLPLKNMVLHHG